MKDILDCSLLAHNTFGIEARCRRFLEFDTVDEARQVAAILAHTDMPFIIVGEAATCFSHATMKALWFIRPYATSRW